MKHFAAALSVVLLLTAWHSAAAEENRPPNIVLAMSDDQGWGDVGYMGHEVLKTPVLDEMARTGLRFDRFYSASPVCSPTRGSVMTGRHPNRFGCFQWGHTLRPQEKTFAQVLKDAGYRTGHFGKWHIGSVHKDSPISPGGAGFDTWLSTPNFYENDPLMAREGKVIQVRGESSRVAVDAALEFIREATGEDKPFLAVIWFGSPHRPHIATEEFKKLYPGQRERLQHFYGEITGIDHAMGVLREQLRELDVADNTVVWFKSDNGALQNEGSTGGLRGWKGDVWEGGIRVPAIVEWPAKIKENRIIATPCSTVDILPTVLELAGLDVPEHPPLDGVSLVPLIEGEMDQRPPLGFWHTAMRGIGTSTDEILREMAEAQAAGRQWPVPDLDANAHKIETQRPLDDRAGHAAWIDGEWKLHRIEKEGEVEYSLFNVDDDMREQRNRIDDEAQARRAERMKRELEAWLESVIRSLNGEDYAERP